LHAKGEKRAVEEKKGAKSRHVLREDARGRRPLPMRELDSLSVTIVVDNFYDALLDDPPCGKRFRTTPNNSLFAEHGLSFFVKASCDKKVYSFMFDFGVDGEALMHNLRLLDLDPKTVSSLLLSHGHFDHYGGLPTLVSYLSSSDVKGLPFYCGEGAFTRRFSKRPGKEELIDLGEAKKEDISLVADLREIKGLKEFLPGCYAQGPIEMESEYEEIPDNLFVQRGKEKVRDDFKEEIAIFFVIKGKGLVILSGCAHRGIVNTVRHIVKITGIQKVHAILGGFHLIHADEKRIITTIADLEAYSLDYVVPCHCTGFSARILFSELMKEKFIINTAGTEYIFKGHGDSS
jgi:7,8-dihydropterin-6-yl-methyl-4-(beta-D-ribofuranosyl)aminobenzene 5'-phosphate synthase